MTTAKEYVPGDLVQFAVGDVPAIGRMLFVLDADPEHGKQWRVVRLLDSGIYEYHNVWEHDLCLWNHCDFNPHAEIEFVVWDALKSGKSWT